MSLLLSQAIHRARRALDSGRALFRENLVPECHSHLKTALTTLLAAWASGASGETSTTTDPRAQAEHAIAALESAGYPGGEHLRAVILASEATTDSLAQPARKRTAGGPEGHRPDLEVSWGEIERLYRFTVRRLDPPLGRQRKRLAAAAVAGFLLVLLVVVVWRLWGRPVATASAVYSSHHPAANAIDGLLATEWLLPDDTPGWLQISYHSPRAVHAVRLLNAHNIHFQDRAAENVRVTAYCEHQAVASAEGRFAQIVADRSPLDLDLRADCVTHLRVEVLSYFKTGGGLAEVEVR